MSQRGKVLNILVDHRERKSPVVEVLRQMPDNVLQFEYLKSGDYMIDGKLLVERKTLSDFAESLKDGRLFDQATRLASNFLPSMIILEGKTDVLSVTEMRREAIQGAIISLMLKFGIPVLRTIDSEETARILLFVGRQTSYSSLRVPSRRSQRRKSAKKVQVHMLEGIPRIGPTRAMNLISAFGTIKKLVEATEVELVDVKGIGHKLAKMIRMALNDEGSLSSC